jgi:hypothetical protein
MEFLGITDLMDCLDGDLGACVMLVVGALPWGKIFKAPKIAEAIYKAGKAVMTFSSELRWAKQILSGAKKAKEAAEAAKAAAAKAAREAAAKAAQAKAAADAKVKQLAAEAKERARAQAAKKKADTTGKGDTCNSFLPGTLVLLADGTRKPIEDLEPGDEVLAGDEETGHRLGARLVTAHIKGSGEKILVTVTVRDDDGDELLLVATDEHPFWNPEKRTWVDAIDLRSGDWLKTSAGTWVKVADVEVDRKRSVVYNLAVDRDPTYYVLAGAAAVLVHNASPEQCRTAVQDMDHQTSGVLDVQVDEVPFASGGRGSGGFVDDMGARVPGMTPTNYHHVEMQAAAYMRRNNIGRGVLYINHPDGICQFCSGSAYTRPGGSPVRPIEDALPQNAIMWVYDQGGSLLGRFTGNSR